ncbi:hypothetical protein [Pandoraea oxalativorans]|uniref:Flagellar hook-associated protein 1 n=1 Tax=Pandoraea oxalativorans TaxID=573737 RepID=A0A0E3YAA0_9BURK|nr:hypothetical protein [Pandoraea oxalativorans]AKC68716.1 hypothetical protein MB84_03440 [Pandoraea oxalativorans]
MIYRTLETNDAPRLGGVFVQGARSASQSRAGDNPLLSAMQRASEQMDGLRASVDEWLGNARARSANARDARGWLTSIDEMQRRLRASETTVSLPDGLRDFAVRHSLMSTSQASGALGAAALDSLSAGVQSMASGASESATVEQIELKQFLSRYENALTLSNAVTAKLRDIMSKITASL